MPRGTRSPGGGRSGYVATSKRSKEVRGRADGDDAPTLPLLGARPARRAARARRAPVLRARSRPSRRALRSTGGGTRRECARAPALTGRGTRPRWPRASRCGSASSPRSVPSDSVRNASSTPTAGSRSATSQRGLRQRAGLVQADDLGGRERLDRVQLLGERPAPRHPERRHGEGHARQEDQPFGNERHDAGDRGRDRLVEGLVGLPQRVPEDGAERHHHGDHHDQEEVQSPLERRARMPEGPGHVRDLLGVAVLADRRHRVEPGALGGERAGTHLVPGKPGHGLRLPGQDRLVQREPVRLVENAVRDELVAGLDSDQIAGARPLPPRPSAGCLPARRSRGARRGLRAGRAPASRATPGRSRFRRSQPGSR